MRRVIDIAASGAWPTHEARAQVTLTFEDRYRRRIVLTADDGTAFLLNLAEARALEDGDGLRLDDGAWVAVRAAGEAVCDIACATPEHLARVAWHLGNRHLPVQVIPGGLRIRDDRVVVDMLQGLGAAVTRREAPFHPEHGAYARGHAHGDHHHDHAHAHD